MAKNPNLPRLQLLTTGLLVLVLWIWEFFEHFVLEWSFFTFAIEIVPLATILIVGLHILFGQLKRAFDRIEQSRRDLVGLERYHASLLDNAPCAIIAIDSNAQIQRLNSHAESIIGYPVSEAVGMNALELFCERERIEDALRTARADAEVKRIEEMSLRTKHRSVIPAAVSVRWLLGSNDSVRGAVLMIEDLREKKRVERRLLISERIATMNQIVAGLAHEIRNPLASIGVNVRNIEEEIRAPGGSLNRTEKHLSMIASDVEKLSNLVDEVLTLAIQNDVKLTSCECSVVDLLGEVLDDHRGLIHGKQIKVVTSFPRSPLTVNCHHQQITRAFSNIIKNAIEAMPLTGGELKIEARELNGWCQLSIADTGCGVPPEHLHRVFDFYFSTKEDGMGLGLSLACLVIEQHGGRIEVESEVGEGTQVMVRLPLRKLGPQRTS